MTSRLDGNSSVSYELIVFPLIIGYGLLLLFYLVFTIFLPPLLLRDLNAAALAEEEELTEEEAGVGGVIEAVSQQLAPPVLVQQSSTLFRRMGNSAMFERFMKIGPFDSADSSSAPESVTASSDGGVPPVIDLESGEGEEVGKRDLGPSDEYDALEKDIESWVRVQQQQHQARVRKPRPAGRVPVVPAAPDTTVIPVDLKQKLRRLVALKEQLAAAACAEACGTAYATPDPQAVATVSESGVAPAPKVSKAHSSHLRRSVEQPRAPDAVRDVEDGADAHDHCITIGEGLEHNGDRGGAGSRSGQGGMVELVDMRAAPIEHSPTPVAEVLAETAVSGGETEDAVPDGDTDGALAVCSDALSAAGSEDAEDEDDDKCLICFAGPRDAVLLECGHGGLCYACARRCLRKKGRECPICRQSIAQVVQIRLDDQASPASPSHHTGVVRVMQTGLDEVLDS